MCVFVYKDLHFNSMWEAFFLCPMMLAESPHHASTLLFYSPCHHHERGLVCWDSLTLSLFSNKGQSSFQETQSVKTSLLNTLKKLEGSVEPWCLCKRHRFECGPDLISSLESAYNEVSDQKAHITDHFKRHKNSDHLANLFWSASNKTLNPDKLRLGLEVIC